MPEKRQKIMPLNGVQPTSKVLLLLLDVKHHTSRYN